MAFSLPPQADLAEVLGWCATRVPDHALDQVRVECRVDGRDLTVVERRVPFVPGTEDGEWTVEPVARLRYFKTNRTRALYWLDRDSRYHRYDWLALTPSVTSVLAELDDDPTHLFWG